jgi:uncharacterized protein
MRFFPAPAKSAPLLVLGHGAGAGQAHPWMTRMAQGLAVRGIHVVTFDFPFKADGRKLPDKGPVLETAFAAVWGEALADAKKQGIEPTRLFAGGKSMGGRIASQITALGGLAPGPDGLVFFGYPLHPPNRPAQRRDRHLPAISVPLLFIHGTRDGFGSPEEMRDLVATLATARLELVEGGDHSLERGKRQDPGGRGLDAVMDIAAEWMHT